MDNAYAVLVGKF